MKNIIELEKGIFLGEIIGEQDFKQWEEQNSIINISAGTGAGKSTLIKKDLYDYCVQSRGRKRILMLLHRKDTMKQFKKELENNGITDSTITIDLYQNIEKQRKFLNKYTFIVCDEFHYFLTDSSINNYTDISLEKLFNCDKTKIVMSATGKEALEYIKSISKSKVITYRQEPDYNFINKLSFFKAEETIYDILDKVEGKTIVFYNNCQKLYDLYKVYESKSMFLCSSNAKPYNKYVDNDKREALLEEKRFNEDILFTTSCMDAGLDILDPQVKNIVIANVTDIIVIKQMLGRKRIQNGEKINVYIQFKGNKSLAGSIKKLQEKIKHAEYLIENGQEKYVNWQTKDNDKFDIVYSESINGETVFKVNMLAYTNALRLIKLYKRYKDCKGGMAQIVGMELGGIVYYKKMEEDNKRDSLKIYLESIVDKRLGKEEQKELIDKIDYRVDGHQKKSYSQLNNALRDTYGETYIIIPKKSGSKRYWVLTKIEK